MPTMKMKMKTTLRTMSMENSVLSTIDDLWAPQNLAKAKPKS
jgi:hypothetical protein